jgi:spore maturation protein CgeB
MPSTPSFKVSVAGKRILIVAPAFHPWDLGRYLSRLLEQQGATVIPFGCQAYFKPAHVKRALADAMVRNNPELIFGQSPARLQGELLEICRSESPDLLLGLSLNRTRATTLRQIRSLGTSIVSWYVDCFDDRVPAWMRPLLPHLDRLATTARGLVPHYREAGASDARWVMEGVYLPAYPRRIPQPAALYRSDVAFAGNLYHPAYRESDAHYRPALLRAVQETFQLKVWGAQGMPGARARWGEPYPVIEWPTYGGELVKVCRASKIMLGVNLINRVDRYFSNRTFLTLAAGGFHLTHYVPGLEKMFDNHRHLVWYHDLQECLDLIAHYLPRDAEREQIARTGMAHVRRRYGMKRQLAKVLRGIV